MGRLLMAGVAAASLAITMADAQPPAGQAAAGEAAARVDARAVVAEMRKVIAANYVLPEMRPKLDAALAAGLASGRYAVTDPTQLAERLNADMQAVAHDKHLGIHHDPEQAALIGTRRDDVRQDGAAFARLAQLRNHGLTEMKVLPGNVRYLAIDGFVWTGPESARAYDVAMQFLKGGDAVIIDLRRNGGGSPAAVQYAISHFLEPSKPIVTFYMRGDPADAISSLGELPAGRMVGKPLYVLTSGGSASAAEEFTGHVKGFRLGELIGENTAGAGYRNEFFAIPGGFAFSVSVGRAVLASTGSDWEGRGFAPDTAVPAGKALDVAQVHALRKLAAATASPREKAQFEQAATLLAAKVEGRAPSLPLSAYAGRFGERTVSLEEGKLVFQRQGGPKLTLVALGDNQFGMEEDPAARIRFAVAGSAATAFELVRGDGSKVEAARSQ